MKEEPGFLNLYGSSMIGDPRADIQQEGVLYRFLKLALKSGDGNGMDDMTETGQFSQSVRLIHFEDHSQPDNIIKQMRSYIEHTPPSQLNTFWKNRLLQTIKDGSGLYFL